jgi:hypothetical protein
MIRLKKVLLRPETHWKSTCWVSERRVENVKAQAAQDDQTCRGYGVQPGSDPYVKCRLQLAQQHSNDNMQAAADHAEAGRQLVDIGAKMMAPPPQPVLVQPVVVCRGPLFC